MSTREHSARPWPAPPPSGLQRRLTPSPLLVALDIDGTLAPLAPTPAAASVPVETRALLTALAERRDVHLAFVTGRSAPDGRRLVDVPNSWVIGNHGMELIDPGGAIGVNLEVEPHTERVARALRTLRARVGDTPGVILEDKLRTLSVHYRLVARDAVPSLTRAVRDVAEHEGLRLTQGKEVHELRPPIDVNKGTAIIALAVTLGVVPGPAPRGNVFYAGDDSTDEDAFRILRQRSVDAVTVHVGSSTTENGSPTAAEFLVNDTTEMTRLIEWLVAAR